MGKPGNNLKRGMSFSEYARHRNVTPGAVTRALQNGWIKCYIEGTRRLISPEEADRDWDNARVRDVSDEKRRYKNGEGVPTNEPAAPVAGDGRHAAANATFGEARAAHETVKVNLANLEFQRRVGRYIDAERVRAEVANLCRVIRNGVIGIPDRMAPVVSNASQDEAHKLLTDECNRVLENLSDAIRKL